MFQFSIEYWGLSLQQLLKCKTWFVNTFCGGGAAVCTQAPQAQSYSLYMLTLSEIIFLKKCLKKWNDLLVSLRSFQNCNKLDQLTKHFYCVIGMIFLVISKYDQKGAITHFLDASLYWKYLLSISFIKLYYVKILSPKTMLIFLKKWGDQPPNSPDISYWWWWWQ